MASKPSTTRKRTTRAAQPGRATRKPRASAAKVQVTAPNPATKALVRSLGKGWAATGSTMPNKVHLRYNGRTVLWLVQPQGNPKAVPRAYRRALGLTRGVPATVAVARQYLRKAQAANLA